MAYRHLEDRIVPERIAIVGVLVARRDRKYPAANALEPWEREPNFWGREKSN
jgi:hypothetical protein